MRVLITNRRRGGKGIYVGRPFPLGNPFRIGRDGNREEVIAKYRAWFEKALEDDPIVQAEVERLARLLRERGSLELTCWCSPRPCHAEVIARYLEARLGEEVEIRYG